ncbi:MAG: hypothetical protein WKF40_12130 [Thermoleophilaceae bacterium]
MVWLAIDATLEGVELAGEGSQAFGGPALVFLGAVLAYLALSGIDAWVRGRREAAEAEGIGSARLALLISVGIGLHNLGEGLAIGSAYALGALALGAFLVIGFVLQNTTEGLAIVVPYAQRTVSRGSPRGAWAQSRVRRRSPAPGSAARPTTAAWPRCCSAPGSARSSRSSNSSCPRSAIGSDGRSTRPASPGSRLAWRSYISPACWSAGRWQGCKAGGKEWL